MKTAAVSLLLWLAFLTSLTLLLMGAEDTASIETECWGILQSAISRGGPNADDVFLLLGSIDDQRARSLLTATFKGTNGTAIEHATRDLSPAQCRFYFKELQGAALNPAIEPKGNLLSAIGHAGTAEAAQLLAFLAKKEVKSTAGIAFGILEYMGPVANPVTEEEAVHGRTAWARETATWMIGRMKTPRAIAICKLNLRDTDERVRIAGAVELARMGVPAGKSVLESAVQNTKSDAWTEVLVALAGLGDPQALQAITRFLNGSDEATKGRIAWSIVQADRANLRNLAYQLKLEAKPEFRSMVFEKLLQPSNPRDLEVLKSEALTACNQVIGMVALQRLISAGVTTRVNEPLRCGLLSNNEPVQNIAVQTALQQPNLWPVLADQLSSPAPIVQWGALAATEKLGQKDKFRFVEKHLTSDVRMVALTAAKTLKALDPKEAEVVFKSLLKSTNEYVRIYSAAMLLAINRAAGNGTSVRQVG